MPNPASRQDPQDMTMSEANYVPGQYLEPLSQPISAGSHLFWRFSAGTAISKKIPRWYNTLDLRARPAFVFSVVPFHQIGFDFRCKTSQFRSAASPHQRTREHSAERKPF